MKRPDHSQRYAQIVAAIVGAETDSQVRAIARAKRRAEWKRHREEMAERNDKIAGARFRGVTYAEIARKFGISKGRVSVICERAHVIGYSKKGTEEHAKWYAEMARNHPHWIVDR